MANGVTCSHMPQGSTETLGLLVTVVTAKPKLRSQNVIRDLLQLFAEVH